MNIQETIEKAPHTGVILVDRAGIPDALELTATNSSAASYLTRFRDDTWPDARYLLLHYGVGGWVYWACRDAIDLRHDTARVLERLPDAPVPWFICASAETMEILKPLKLSRGGSLH
jgi:hypothetical protein